MNKKKVKVYNTFTGKVVDVEVTQEVYDEYMRTAWNIHDNNESLNFTERRRSNVRDC